MHTISKRLRAVAAFAALAALGAGSLTADTIKTTDGATLVGKITKVDGGVIEIDTTYAGTLKVKQSAVESFATDNPVTVRFKDGNTVIGTVSGASGEVKVAGGSVSASGSIANVTNAWLPGEDSPEQRALKAGARKWKFEASVDVLGKKGNSDSFASSLGFKATLEGPQDKLAFNASVARAEQDGVKTVNQASGGIDYQSNFSPKYSWYVREQIGMDRIQGLDFFSNTAAGIGFDWIKTDKQVLTIRTGLAYRYESYDNGSNVSAPALDLALIHDYTAATWKIGNRITFLPTFEDFGIYRILHDSFFETPLAAGPWKIRVGISNDYNSDPLPGKKDLDTTYYTKFVLGWE